MGCLAFKAKVRVLAKQSSETAPGSKGSTVHEEVTNSDEATDEGMGESDFIHAGLQSSAAGFQSPPIAAGSISRSSSGASARSNMSSMRSFSSKANKHTRRSNVLDEMQSDVPTITESIADMQDLGDDETCSIASSSLNRSHGSYALQGPIVDSRNHPFAPVVSFMDSQQVSRNPTVGDLGVCSDISSIGDDVSVISGPSDIHMNFFTSEETPKCSKKTRNGLTSSSACKYECSSPAGPSVHQQEWPRSHRRHSSNDGQSAQVRVGSTSSSTRAEAYPSASDEETNECRSSSADSIVS